MESKEHNSNKKIACCPVVPEQNKLFLKSTRVDSLGTYNGEIYDKSIINTNHYYYYYYYNALEFRLPQLVDYMGGF